MSTAPLPRKVDHQFGEPAYAFLIRTLEHNGARRIPTALDRVTGTRGRAVSQLDPAEVARLCKTDPTSVEHATPVLVSTVAKVMGQEISAEHVGLRSRRWCPRCLAEQPYHRVWWDVLPVTSCPTHGVKLTASCGCSRKGLPWRSSRLHYCNRGHDLRLIACEPADPAILAFDAYVVARLRGDCQDTEPLLDGVPLGLLLTACERLGKEWLDQGASIHEARSRHGVGLLHAEGFRILLGLPVSFELLLERLRSGADDRRGREGLVKSYGTFYEYVRELPDFPFANALRRAIFEHADRHFAFRVRGRSREGLAPIETLTLTEAADAVPMPLVRFRDLLDQLEIPYRAHERGKCRSYRTEITREAFDALRPRLDGYRTLGRLARELDLPGLDLADLAGAGLLDVIAPGQGKANWLFPVDAAPKFLARLAGKAVGLEPAMTQGFLPLLAAAKECKASVAEVVALALDGVVEMRIDGAQPRTLSSFRVEPSALAGQLSRQGDAGYTPTVAARMLGLSQATLGAVLAEGILDTCLVNGGVRVPSSGIERFRARFATMSELRRAMGVLAFQPVVEVLSAAEISPAASAGFNSERIYPREAAMRACREAASRRGPAPVRGESRSTVARQLRMSMRMLRQSVSAGLITMQEGCPFGSLAPAEIARFKDAYVTTTELGEMLGIRSNKTLVGILRRAKVQPTCSPPEYHFHLYPRRVAEEAVRSWMETETARPEPCVDDELKLGVADIARRLNAVPNMVNQLLRVGMLVHEQAGIRGARRWLVRSSEVERFSRTYVFASELGRLAGREQRHGVARTITTMLLNNGLRPVCSTPEFCGFMFVRDEAIALMHKLGYPCEPAT